MGSVLSILSIGSSGTVLVAVPVALLLITGISRALTKPNRQNGDRVSAAD